MAAPVEDRGAIGFAEKVLGLLDEGRFTATYKFAVLLGLMDLCLESGFGLSRTSAERTLCSVRVGTQNHNRQTAAGLLHSLRITRCVAPMPHGHALRLLRAVRR